MNIFWQDVKFGVRMLIKNRSTTLIAVAALALGIGANTAIFSVVDAILLRPFPYPEPERLVMVWADLDQRGGPKNEWTNPADFNDWRRQSQSIEDMAAISGAAPTLTGFDEPEQLRGAAVTHTMFNVLKRMPAQGRNFSAEEDQPNGPRVAIISDGLWKRRFGSDPAFAGKTITLNDIPTTVIGIMPPGFVFPVIPNREVWVPLQANLSAGRGNAFLRVVGRMRPGVAIEQAQAEMATIGGQLAAQYPDTSAKTSIFVQPLREKMAGEIRPRLLLLLGAVGFVVLIACANVANLLLARAAARQREMGIRLALGAGHGRVIRQVLTESSLLALLGGVTGALLAVWGLDLLLATMPQALRGFVEFGIDSRVLLFTLGLSLLTGLLFGLAPALQVARQNLSGALQEGSRGATGGRRVHALRNVLVVANFALALTLAIGAGLFLKSLVLLQHVDPGFRAENLLTATVITPSSRYPQGPQLVEFYGRLMERLSGLPSVRGAAGSSTFPLTGSGSDTSFQIEGRPTPPPDQEPVAWYSQVTPGFHQVMGIRLIDGRLFTEADHAQSPRVAIVNETFVKRHFPNENPIGKRIGQTDPANPQWREIVGVASNVKFFSMDREQPPAMYLPLAQVPARRMFLAIRTEGDPLALAAAVRKEVAALDKNLAVANIGPAVDLISDSIAQQRLTTSLIGLFAGLALVLAAVGIYGVMSYSVTQRTQEIGVRMALGAAPGDVLRMVLRQGLLLGGIGVAVGLAGVLVLKSLISKLLFGVSPLDLPTYAAIAVLLIVVALVACLIPARRATRVDPMIALRYE